MATWTTTAQLTTGTLGVNATDIVWFNSGVNVTDNVVVSSYQDYTHISNSGNVHQCTTNHVNNIKYTGSTTMSLNGGTSTALLSTLQTSNAPLKINFTDAASVSTTGGKFYFYDGTTDATAMSGVTVQAIEIISNGSVSNSNTWTAANGSAAALSITDDTSATTHDFYIGCSLSPVSTGAKTGKYKLTLTYV